LGNFNARADQHSPSTKLREKDKSPSRNPQIKTKSDGSKLAEVIYGNVSFACPGAKSFRAQHLFLKMPVDQLKAMGFVASV